MSFVFDIEVKLRDNNFRWVLTLVEGDIHHSALSPYNNF